MKKKKIRMHTVGHKFIPRKSQKRGKLEVQIVGPGIWQEN